MIIEAGKTYIRTLRALSSARDPLAVQLRLGNTLSAIDLQPPGLPTSAIVCIRSLRAPPLATHGGPAPLWWEERVRVLIDQAIRHAARPLHENVPAHCEAVIFADRAELLASLASDWSTANSSSRWWWQNLLRSDNLGQVLMPTWLESPEYVPAALLHLASGHRVQAFAERLAIQDVRTLLHTIVQRFGLHELQPVLARIDADDRPYADSQQHIQHEDRIGPVSAASSEDIQHRPHVDSSPRIDETPHATGQQQHYIQREAVPLASTARERFSAQHAPFVAADRSPWSPWVPESTQPGLHFERQALLGIGLMLMRAPAIVRSTAFARTTNQWYHALPPTDLSATPYILDASEAIPSSTSADTCLHPSPLHSEEANAQNSTQRNAERDSRDSLVYGYKKFPKPLSSPAESDFPATLEAPDEHTNISSPIETFEESLNFLGTQFHLPSRGQIEKTMEAANKAEVEGQATNFTFPRINAARKGAEASSPVPGVPQEQAPPTHLPQRSMPETLPQSSTRADDLAGIEEQEPEIAGQENASVQETLQPASSPLVAPREANFAEDDQVVVTEEKYGGKQLSVDDHSLPATAIPAENCSPEEAKSSQSSIENAPASLAMNEEILPGPSETHAEGEFATRIETAYGGLFYLINLGLFLNLYSDFTAPLLPGISLSIWDFLALLGQQMLDESLCADRLWLLLASLAGRHEEEPPGHYFEPPEQWRVHPEWLSAFPGEDSWGWCIAGERLHVMHPAQFLLVDLPLDGDDPSAQLEREMQNYRGLFAQGAPQLRAIPASLLPTQTLLPCGRPAVSLLADNLQPPLQPLQRWLSWLMPYVYARLQRALGLEDGEDPSLLLCKQHAEITLTDTHIQIILALDELPISIRLAGLDRNPGWVPAAGRFITFHFQ